MPKKIIAAGSDYTGVSLEWTPSTRRLYVTGWYDGGYGGTGGKVWPLETLCKELGITAKDLEYVARGLRADALVDLVRRS